MLTFSGCHFLHGTIMVVSNSSIQASAGPLVSLLADCMIFLIFPGWVAARDMAPGM